MEKNESWYDFAINVLEANQSWLSARHVDIRYERLSNAIRFRVYESAITSIVISSLFMTEPKIYWADNRGHDPNLVHNAAIKDGGDILRVVQLCLEPCLTEKR